MGQLVDGVWQDTWYDTKSTGGRFKRSVSAFRNWLTADGAAGPSGEGGFAAEKDRYHLYVSLACPWAHRTLIMRKLKGLEPFLPVSVVNPLMLENGWTFDDSFPEATGDTLYQHDFLYQLYLHADPHYTGRVTVPVLWDKKQQTIVSNESAEIIRMFNTAFDGLGARAGDYYPPALREQIDELNGWIYDNVNNGVYKAGFATSQQAYDEAVDAVFTSLERLEQILGQHRYLTGNQLTEASRGDFERMRKEIAERPASEGLVIGHTDRVGELEANDALSRKRAETVKTLLRAASVNNEIEVSGRGEREPIVRTEDEVAEAANRRVEINVR